MSANTPIGSSVMVITTIFAVTGRCIHITSRSKNTASIVLRVSSIPPNSFPESV